MIPAVRPEREIDGISAVLLPWIDGGAAIDWAGETWDGELLLRLATALWGFWATRGHIAEGTAVLEEALVLAGTRPAYDQCLAPQERRVIRVHRLI